MAALTSKESEDTALESRGYTLGKKLGQGSYAKVRMAEYRAGEKVERLACKIVDKNVAPKDFLAKFFPRELDIIPKMDHPSVIRVHSILERNMKVYIFMQCAENGDLLEHIQKNGVIPEARTRAWVQQMISGLIYLHNLNICHRDLKCENVLITKNHNLKIADLGFARYVVDAEGKRVLSHTYCGSAAYAAPEVVKGTPYNPKMADVWSMGVIVYIMVNASMPFDDGNLNKMLRDQLNRNWSFRSKVRDKMSPDLKTMITKMIEPDLTKRFTADQVQQCEWMNRS